MRPFDKSIKDIKQIYLNPIKEEIVKRERQHREKQKSIKLERQQQEEAEKQSKQEKEIIEEDEKLQQENQKLELKKQSSNQNVEKEQNQQKQEQIIEKNSPAAVEKLNKNQKQPENLQVPEKQLDPPSPIIPNNQSQPVVSQINQAPQNQFDSAAYSLMQTHNPPIILSQNNQEEQIVSQINQDSQSQFQSSAHTLMQTNYCGPPMAQPYLYNQYPSSGIYQQGSQVNQQGHVQQPMFSRQNSNQQSSNQYPSNQFSYNQYSQQNVQNFGYQQSYNNYQQNNQNNQNYGNNYNYNNNQTNSQIYQSQEISTNAYSNNNNQQSIETSQNQDQFEQPQFVVFKSNKFLSQQQSKKVKESNQLIETNLSIAQEGQIQNDHLNSQMSDISKSQPIIPQSRVIVLQKGGLEFNIIDEDEDIIKNKEVIVENVNNLKIIQEKQQNLPIYQISERTCQNHNQNIVLICKEKECIKKNKQLVCPKCLSEHRNHNCDCIESLLYEIENNIKQHASGLELIDQVEFRIGTQFKQITQSILQDLTDMENSFKNAFNSLRNQLQVNTKEFETRFIEISEGGLTKLLESTSKVINKQDQFTQIDLSEFQLQIKEYENLIAQYKQKQQQENENNLQIICDNQILRLDQQKIKNLNDLENEIEIALLLQHKKLHLNKDYLLMNEDKAIKLKGNKNEFNIKNVEVISIEKLH